jgi:hypothetical protein
MTTATVLLLFARICIGIAMQSNPLLPLTLNIRGGSLVGRDSPSSSPRKPNAQCQESSSVNDAREYIAPNIYDVMLMDVNHTILVKQVAEILEVKYLGPAQNVLRFPLHGILFGNNRRVMVNFSCRRCSLGKIYPWLNIIFLCDTGAPNSYLSEHAMSALIGSADNIPEVLRVDTGTLLHPFHLSIPGSHFSEVNVLGMDFMCKASLSIMMDAAADFVELRQHAITATYE